MIRSTLVLVVLTLGSLAQGAVAHRSGFPICAGDSGVLESRDRAGVLRFTNGGLKLALVDHETHRVWGVNWSIDGANNVSPRGVGSRGLVNRFLASGTRIGLPSYASVVYDEIRDGVSLEVENRPGAYKYTVRCAAGVDVAALRYRYDGVATMTLSPDGLHLAMTTGLVPMREDGLIVRQDGRRIAARFTDVRHEQGLIWTYGIELGAHDSTQPIEIDPTVTYSMLVGGNWVDGDGSIRADAAGNAYFAMYCGSSDMTTVGGFQDTLNGSADLFVAKLDAAGATVWSTYYGGSGVEQMPFLAVDGGGNVLVFSMTDSSDLPTLNAFQPSSGGGWDCFVLKIAAAGDAVLWASYLASNGLDNSAGGMALDSSGNAYVAGFTSSTWLPGINSGFDSTLEGGSDGFVAKINANGTIAWSSFVGGSASDDRSMGITVDAGHIYVCGNTTTGFPATTGAYDTTSNGAGDGYVMKINMAGPSVAWATYLGGSGGDTCVAIGVDSSGNVIVSGGTSSTDYPTVNAAQGTLNGTQDFNVTKVAADGASLLWSTYLGAAGQENARGLAMDSSGNAYIAGVTSSTSWPGVSGGFQTTPGGGYDGVVAKVTPTGSLAWSSFLGGSGADFLLTCDVNATGLYLEGWTMGSFPVTDSSILSGFADLFVVKVALDPPPAPLLVVTPTDLTFSATEGGAAPASQPATLTNSGGGTLNWTASDDAAWLTASATSGALDAGVSASVSLSIDPTGLTAGLYLGTFTITDGAIAKTVTAHLTISAPPAVLTVTPPALSFAATAGTGNPALQTMTIGNAGGSPLAWTGSDDAGWLSQTMTNGTLAAGASQNVDVGTDITGLVAGTYNGTITVTDGSATKTVTVQLVVNAAPGVLSVGPTDLGFIATQGAPAPTGQSVTVANTGGISLSWGSGQNASWLLVSPASGVVAPGSSQAMNVAVDHAGLAPGAYVGAVQVSDGVTTQTVTVRLTVNAPASAPVGASEGHAKKKCGASAGGGFGAIWVVMVLALALVRRSR